MGKRVFCTLLTCILLLSGCGTTLETSDSQQKTGGTEAGTEAESMAGTESESEDRTEAGDSEDTSSAVQSDSSNAGSGDIQDDLDTLSAYYLSFGVLCLSCVCHGFSISPNFCSYILKQRNNKA